MYRGDCMYHSYHVKVRGQLAESVLLFGCMSWRLNSGANLGSKCLDLLSHLSGPCDFLFCVYHQKLLKQIRGNHKNYIYMYI